jgi:hypothetical protein
MEMEEKVEERQRQSKVKANKEEKRIYVPSRSIRSAISLVRGSSNFFTKPY